MLEKELQAYKGMTEIYIVSTSYMPRNRRTSASFDAKNTKRFEQLNTKHNLKSPVRIIVSTLQRLRSSAAAKSSRALIFVLVDDGAQQRGLITGYLLSQWKVLQLCLESWVKFWAALGETWLSLAYRWNITGRDCSVACRGNIIVTGSIVRLMEKPQESEFREPGKLK